MKRQYDVIIIGIGAMGSATAYNLSKTGKKILGIDRYTPPHSMGSSHGNTRIIREAYFEDPQYVPIIQQAYTNWGRLQEEYGRPLYLPTGGLMLGSPDCKIIKGALLSAKLHNLSHQLLDAKQISKIFPAFRPPADTVAVLEPRAGIIFPEEAIKAHLSLATKNGADFLFNELAISWKEENGGVRVSTAGGTFFGDQLLLTAGAWLSELLPSDTLPLSVERQVLYWFNPKDKSGWFSPDRFPVFIWSLPADNDFYGFPNVGDGFKVAKHLLGEPTTPHQLDRSVNEEEIEIIRSFLERYIPNAAGILRSTAVCMYTNTPDRHFRIARVPGHSQVLAASICSGHGYKFASAMGQILSEILNEQQSSFDLSLFGYPSTIIK